MARKTSRSTARRRVSKRRRVSVRPARVPQPSLSIPDLPSDLVMAVAAGECVLYAGAGLSARAGLPTWFQFVRGLLDWSTGTGRVDPSFAHSLHEALERDPDLVADSLVSRLMDDPEPGTPRVIPPDVISYLSSVFAPEHIRPGWTHELLKKIPFSAALTTNLDELIEGTFTRSRATHTHEDAQALLSRLTRPDFYVLKLYGTLSLPSSVLLAPAQYRSAVAENRLYARYMEGLFASKTLLFVGASLKGILDYMSGFRFGGKSTREHYAIVDVTGSAWQVNADALLRHYGIRVLPYTASPGFPEIDIALERLHSLGKSAPAPAHVTAGTPGVLIKRVELTNIGPFDELALDFRPNWNLLLGDNGVGKSSVLKAIALALSGTDAKEYAGRLIKSGTHVSTITVETGARRYVTELYRTDSEAEMKVPPTLPLSLEGWLAMGFPPLRALTWNRSEETVRALGQPRPTSADLLPLVKAEFDPRVDRLKGWLIDLHRQESTAAAADKVRFRRQREKLFEVIAALTPGLTLREAAFDPHRAMEILVQTDDGTVPIEAVSQGTSSLIGWIGVLVQRLFDVYHDKSEPWLEPALVLIDEVDAHMHPKWQRTLAPALQQVFPNLQIIGTTHSPLMVPSLDPEQVIVFKRQDNKLSATQQSAVMKGYRADQVLTSEVFGLASSLPPETEDDLREYTRLVTSDRLSRSDERRLQELAERLRMRMPSTSERQEARDAYDLLRQSVEQKVANMPVEQREKVVTEMRLQLQEAITGSRRPA